jgi:hypothetical protein
MIWNRCGTEVIDLLRCVCNILLNFVLELFALFYHNFLVDDHPLLSKL